MKISCKRIHNKKIRLSLNNGYLFYKITSSSNFLIAVDSLLGRDVIDKSKNFVLFLRLSDYFFRVKDNINSIHFINSAIEINDYVDTSKVSLLIQRLIRFGRLDDAAKIVFKNSVRYMEHIELSNEDKFLIINYIEQTFSNSQRNADHGHELLISYLEKNLSILKQNLVEQSPIMIEIGTTREKLLGQCSTKKLAEFCLKNGLHFITVDMDPSNTERARKLFNEMSVPFDAVNAKGEDYLRNYIGSFDFIFLDAYDFDHGMHSQARQSRYKKYLGAAINDDDCHQMHFECAQIINAKLSNSGLVCIDDTWLDNGLWAAKGTLAVPYLLNSNFKLLDVRNKAVLLARIHL